MHRLVIDVRGLADTLADAARAMHSGCGDAEARIGFATAEWLWHVLSAKRWALLKARGGVPSMP